ncbi:FAD dependent oxidoreductase [Xylariales sp. AK1849]|nr:FAD dependent oxidoreductase [Xylariales sp. AK1849]
MATSTTNDKLFFTSGAKDPVWIKIEDPSQRPQFSALTKDLKTRGVCIVGAGVTGISAAYELVSRGVEVVLVEARDVLSGETGRTSGHLSNALDEGYTDIKSKHGQNGAQVAADSHTWALKRVGEVSKALGIECEYRRLPGYQISQFLPGTTDYKKDIDTIKADVAEASALKIDAQFKHDVTIKGMTSPDGNDNLGDGAVFANQATFHPTKYLVGILNWLKEQPNFSCFTNTRVVSFHESSGQAKVETESGKTIECAFAVEATCVPLQKLAVIAQMEFFRTYAIAIRIPKDTVEDCLIYDTADPYKYLRITECDKHDDYLVVGGCDHKVGQEEAEGRYEELEKWTRDRFAGAGSVDYKWSGQIFEPVDYLAYIGRNQGNSRILITTGDSGNGLTHGVLASRIITEIVQGEEDSEWAKVYSPKRIIPVLKSAPQMIAHDLQINAQYKRLLQSDIQDIEDLAPGTGGVLNPTASKPLAIYKDENGQITKLSAFCPHMQGVVCWNQSEKSWDCPVHGSRFSAKGLCVMGPAKGNLPHE